MLNFLADSVAPQASDPRNFIINLKRTIEKLDISKTFNFEFCLQEKMFL